MSRKRTSLSAVLGPIGNTPSTNAAESVVTANTDSKKQKSQPKRPGIKQQTAYLPEAVHEQLRLLAFEERRKMHSYIMEGLDLVFRTRGLPSIAELTGLKNEDAETKR